MNLKGQNIKKSLFSEWRTIDTAQSAASIFDITHDQEPTLENYCIALLEKVFTIPQSQLPEFINYQLQLAQDGNTWLNKFEKLLANNEELFFSQKALSRFNKLYNIIEKKTNRTAIFERKRNQTNYSKKVNQCRIGRSLFFIF